LKNLWILYVFVTSSVSLLRRPTCVQADPKRAQELPKWPQDDPKRPQDGPKRGPRHPQGGPKTSPRRLQERSYVHFFTYLHQKLPKRLPGPPQEAPRPPPGTPPGRALEAPGTPPKTSKTPPRGFHRLSICKANVDIDVNVVVPVEDFSYIATNRMNIDKTAGGLRYAILHMIFHGPLAAGGLRDAILNMIFHTPLSVSMNADL